MPAGGLGPGWRGEKVWPKGIRVFTHGQGWSGALGGLGEILSLPHSLALFLTSADNHAANGYLLSLIYCSIDFSVLGSDTGQACA